MKAKDDKGELGERRFVDGEPAPGDGAELAELLGGIADDIELVTELRYERQRSSPIQRVARALSLLLREREANRATVTGMDLGRFGFERWHADDGHDGPLPCPPWREIGGDHRSRWSMSAVAIYDRAHAHLSKRLAKLAAEIAEARREIDASASHCTFLAGEIEKARAAETEASKRFNFIDGERRHALDDVKRLADDLAAARERVAELEAMPPGAASIVALLAAMKAARESGEDCGMREAIEMVREYLGARPTQLDRAAAEVCALLPREYPDGAAEAARIASSKAALAALDVGEGDVIGARAQMADAAADLLAGMLACDPAPVDGATRGRAS